MKKENGFIKFLLVLIVIALAGIIMLFGYVMYNEFAGNGDVDFGNLQLIYPKIENQESDNRINNTKATTDTKISGSTVGTQVLNKNEYQNKYLYSQLGENGKIIYEKLYENKENLKTGTYTIQLEILFMIYYHKKMEVINYKKNIKRLLKHLLMTIQMYFILMLQKCI